MKSYINAISAVVAVVVLFAGNGFAQGTYYMHRPLTVKGGVNGDSVIAKSSTAALQYPGRYGSAPVFGYTDTDGEWGNGVPFCGVAGVAGAGAGSYAIGVAGVAGTNTNATKANIGVFARAYSNNVNRIALLAQEGVSDPNYPAGSWAAVMMGSVWVRNDMEIRGKLKIRDWSLEAPDYVFQDSYNLKPLSEVKTFIEKHSHLPEVPSAKELKEKGVDMLEMNMTLLKKVEELTLYVIEQDRKIVELQKTVRGSN